jgi:hypothetical protein
VYPYTYWGLSLASTDAWPALEAFKSEAAGPAEVYVKVSHGRLTQSVTEGFTTAEQVQFQVAGVGRYHIQGGRVIEVLPEAAASLPALELFLFGSAWGALCYQRGLLPLHASVIQWGSAAYAFCGPSGAGKSTLVAALVERGGRLLSDDLCRCDPDHASGPLVWPSLPRLKLWRASLTALGRSPAGLTQDLASEDKFLLPLAGDRDQAPVPLCGICLLDWGPERCERLSGIAALQQFVQAATYRAEMLDQMGQLAAYWETCAQLLRKVPVFRLSRPKEWSSLAAGIQFLDSVGR